MKSMGVWTVFGLLGVAFAWAQPIHKQSTFWLYPWSHGCYCIKTAKSTASIFATEAPGKLAVYQIFHTRGSDKRELFRVGISTDWPGEWNYGIANEGDINGDGRPDYAWYGGDDTGEEEYVFLSKGDSYRRVDVLKSFEEAWKRRFLKSSPDLGDSDSDCHASSEWLEKTDEGLILHGTVNCENLDGSKHSVQVFRVPEAEFAP